MYAHLGSIAVALAAIGLLKYAIDQNDRWWRPILIVLALAAVTAGLLWVLSIGGRLWHHVGAVSYLVVRDTQGYVENRLMQAGCATLII